MTAWHAQSHGSDGPPCPSRALLSSLSSLSSLKSSSSSTTTTSASSKPTADTAGTEARGYWWLVVVALFAIAFASACPDPCVFLGGGCNDNDDCGAGELCRKSREFESFGCSLVEGRCVSFDDDEDARHRCGSVDDCDEGECCDPATNTCIGEVGYVGLECDEFTCEDCNDTAFGERCELNADCDDDEGCTADSTNAFGTISEKGVCRPSCISDDDCPATQRCSSSVCSVTVGTPCTIIDSEGEDESIVDEQCLGLTCTKLDANNDRLDDGYCTDLCFELGECPSGFVCDDASNECRKL